MTHMGYLRHSVPNVSTTHNQLFSLRVKVSLSFRMSQLTCAMLRKKVKPTQPPPPPYFSENILTLLTKYTWKNVAYFTELGEFFHNYQHTSPNFAWNAARRPLKALCWSVAALHARFVAVRRRPKHGVLGEHRSGAQKDGSRKVLNRGYRESGEEQIQGTDFCGWR